MNVLLTGNQGYIGSVLTRKLYEHGHGVIGFDTGIFRDAAFASARVPAHRQIYKDVRDVTLGDLQGIDVVIHLAALSNDPLGHFKPEITYEINWRASVRLAELAKQAGVKRFLFSSSCSLYGAAGDDSVTEESAFNPQTPYAESKVYAERDIAKLADDNFFPVFLRNATVFGISPRLRLDLVVQDLTLRGYLDGVITILSDGTPWRPLIHVEDVCDAFLLLMQAPQEQVGNQSFNVGRNENNLQVRDIAEMVRVSLPDTRIEIKNENPSDTRSYRVDFSKIWNLGFRPRYYVADGINQIVAAFRHVNFSSNQREFDQYHTLKRYQHLIASGIMDEMLRISHHL